MKRLMDVLASLSALLLLSPILVIVSFGLLCTGENRVFFRQRRVGKGGGEFDLLKFTTMYDSVANRADGGMAVDSDPEVFPLGRLLRRTKLNELPQLWNVLRGDMSLVGPRPLTWKTLDKYDADLRTIILKQRPGLTGAASLVFRDEEEILARAGSRRAEVFNTELLPRKQRIEAWYAARANLRLDLELAFATAVAVLSSSNAVAQRMFPELFAEREGL